jgi:hypothetical protein
MKQMTCAQMGGPATCNVVLPGNTFDEAVKSGMIHVEQAHPDMAAQIKAMSPEDMAKWSAETKPKWDALPDVPAA